MARGVRGRRGAAKAASFDAAKSQRLREQASKAKKSIDETSKTQRVSGRKKSRANELAKIHGRTDEQKKQSLETAKRNRKIATNVLTTALPGGAAAGALVKAKQAASVAKGAANLYKTAKAAKLAKNVKNVKNLAQGAKVAAKRKLQQATGGKTAALATRAKAVGKAAVNKAKVKAKAKAQGAANAGVNQNIG